MFWLSVQVVFLIVYYKCYINTDKNNCLAGKSFNEQWMLPTALLNVWLKLKSRSFLITHQKSSFSHLLKYFLCCLLFLFFFFFFFFFFCRDDRTPQDFGPREHVERINFQELLQHFKNLQQKHFMSKHARPKCRAKNQLLNVWHLAVILKLGL